MRSNEILILPEFWAPAIINRDYSGMEEEDIKELNAFLEKITPDFGYCAGCSEEAWFQHSNDAGTLACNVLEYYFIK